jgi:hypothetical protein
MSYTATKLASRWNRSSIGKDLDVLVRKMIVEAQVVEKAVVRDIVLVEQLFEDLRCGVRCGIVDEPGLDGARRWGRDTLH